MAEESEIKKFQSAVLGAATQAVLAEITPERMQAACESLIGTALNQLLNDPYGLRNTVKQAMEVILKEYLQRPAVQASLRAAVERGINEALPEMPARAKGAVIDVAIKGMVAAVSGEATRRF